MQRRAQNLVARNQRQHRRKAHLEGNTRHFLRHQQHQDYRGQGQATQRYRLPASKQGGRVETRHGKAADDRDMHPGQHHVAAANQ